MADIIQQVYLLSLFSLVMARYSTFSGGTESGNFATNNNLLSPVIYNKGMSTTTNNKIGPKVYTLCDSIHMSWKRCYELLRQGKLQMNKDNTIHRKKRQLLSGFPINISNFPWPIPLPPLPATVPTIELKPITIPTIQLRPFTARPRPKPRPRPRPKPASGTKSNPIVKPRPKPRSSIILSTL